MMVRNDYELMAKALKATMPAAELSSPKFTQWCRDVRAIAKMCEGLTARFDPLKFYAACGVPGAVELEDAA